MTISFQKLQFRVTRSSKRILSAGKFGSIGVHHTTAPNHAKKSVQVKSVKKGGFLAVVQFPFRRLEFTLSIL